MRGLGCGLRGRLGRFWRNLKGGFWGKYHVLRNLVKRGRCGVVVKGESRKGMAKRVMAVRKKAIVGRA
jgi:hypothetical protein